LLTSAKYCEIKTSSIGKLPIIPEKKHAKGAEIFPKCPKLLDCLKWMDPQYIYKVGQYILQNSSVVYISFSTTQPPSFHLPAITMLMRQVDSCYYPSHLSTLYWGEWGPTNDLILKTFNEKRAYCKI